MKRKNARTVELRKLMASHSLSCRQVATMLGKSRQSVKRYTSEHTIIPEGSLELLKYKLADQPEQQ